MKRYRSEFERISDVEKRLYKPSWVKRYHRGDAAAAAERLAEEHGFSGRIAYMRHLCELLADYPQQEEFEQAVRDFHQDGLQEMVAGLADCEIIDDPRLKKGSAPFTATTVGDCFRQAYYYVVDDAPDGSFLIHGKVRQGGKSGPHTGHAWVELPGDVIYDGVLQRFYRRECYYAIRDAQRTLAFPKQDVLMTCGIHRHFGPWTE